MITKLRTSKISIEVPSEGAEPWIHVEIQKILKDDDGKILNIYPRWNYFSEPLTSLAKKTCPYRDFIKTEGLISGYGISIALSSLILTLMVEKYGGTPTSDGDLLL